MNLKRISFLSDMKLEGERLSDIAELATDSLEKLPPNMHVRLKWLLDNANDITDVSFEDTKVIFAWQEVFIRRYAEYKGSDFTALSVRNIRMLMNEGYTCSEDLKAFYKKNKVLPRVIGMDIQGRDFISVKVFGKSVRRPLELTEKMVRQSKCSQFIVKCVEDHTYLDNNYFWSYDVNSAKVFPSIHAARSSIQISAVGNKTYKCCLVSIHEEE